MEQSTRTPHVTQFVQSGSCRLGVAAILFIFDAMNPCMKLPRQLCRFFYFKMEKDGVVAVETIVIAGKK